MPAEPVTPLLSPAEIDRLTPALEAGFTVDAVNHRLDWSGQAALSRGDRSGVARALGNDPTSTLVRAFILAEPVPETALATALGSDSVSSLTAAGLLDRSGGEMRALAELRPYSEADQADARWWVWSDFGSDVRREGLQSDHVLGIGAAAILLAQSTYRPPVERSLDLGTGCGVQALHLTQHSEEVVATDINARALRFAATSAALSGVDVELRNGSLFDPVAAEHFDLIVANPPFIVSPAHSADWSADPRAQQESGYFSYRDSAAAGDDLCRQIVAGLRSRLRAGGTAQLLLNWSIDGDGEVGERVRSWLPEMGVDAWLWQREVADPGEYIALWLRDAGDIPGSPRWRARYDRWRDWFDAQEILAVGMGLLSVRRTEQSASVIVCEDVPQAVEQPVGPRVGAWLDAARWLAQTSDDKLLATAFIVAPDVRLSRLTGFSGHRSDADSLTSTDVGLAASLELVQESGLRWRLETEDSIAHLLAGCDGRTPLAVLCALLADSLAIDTSLMGRAAATVCRDLIQRGFLLRPNTDHSTADR